jgi:hypothetical protein
MKPHECIIDGASFFVDAETPRKAAVAAAKNEVSHYSDRPTATVWVRVIVEGDLWEIAIHPKSPPCEGASHKWESPHSVLGGLRENPGVWGNGGGVIIRECCAHCGAFRETDTWATDPATGEQGLTSVAYADPTEESLRWVARTKGGAE